MQNLKQLVSEANLLYKKGLYEEALSLYKTALTKSPSNSDIFLGIATSQIKLKKFEEAVKNVEKSIKLSSSEDLENDNIKLRHGISKMIFEAGNAKYAFNVFEPIYKNNPTQEDAIKGLKYLVADNQFDRVIKDISGFIGQYPNLYAQLIEDNEIQPNTKNELSKRSELIILSTKKNFQSQIIETEKDLEFVQNNSEGKKHLAEEWNNQKNTFNSTDNPQTISKELHLLKKVRQKIVDERSSIQRNIDRNGIENLLNTNNLSLSGIEQSISILTGLKKLLETFKGETEKINTSVENLNILKQSISAINIEDVQQNIPPTLKTKEIINNSKITILKEVDKHINSQSLSSAKKLNNNLLEYFPNDEDILKKKVFIEEKQKKQRKIIIIIAIGAAVVVLISLLYFGLIKPNLDESKAWNKAQETCEYDNFISEFPQSERLEDAYINRIKCYQKTFVATVDNLAIRSEPSQNGESLTNVYEGGEMKYLEETSENRSKITLRGINHNEPWYKVSMDGVEGWVYGGAISRHSDLGYMCEEYLSVFSDGKFVEDANRILGIIGDRNEETLWQITKKEMTMTSYENYLSTYPNGKYSNEAKSFLQLDESEIRKFLESSSMCDLTKYCTGHYTVEFNYHPEFDEMSISDNSSNYWWEVTIPVEITLSEYEGISKEREHWDIYLRREDNGSLRMYRFKTQSGELIDIKNE